jgi:hypothetical protein
MISVYLLLTSVSGKSFCELGGDKFSEHPHYTLFCSERQDGEVFNFGHSRAINEGVELTVPPKVMAFHLTVLALAHTI